MEIVAGLVGVVIGVMLNVFRDRRAWVRDNVLAAGDSLAELLELAWVEDGDPNGFELHLRKLRLQLQLLGVKGQNTTELWEAATEARKSSRWFLHNNPGYDEENDEAVAVIGSKEIKRLEAAMSATAHSLRPRWWM